MDMTHVSCVPFSNKRHEAKCQEVGRTCTRQDTMLEGMEHLGSSCGNVWPLVCSQHLKKKHSKGGSHLWADGGSREVALCHAQPWSWALVAAGATDKPLVLQRSWPGTPPRPMGIIHRAMAEEQAGHLVLEMNKQAHKKLGSY